MGIWTLITLITAQVGNNILCYVLLVFNMTVFHFCTLEEYYIGTLDLPPLNGVSDGSVPIIGFFLVSGIMGTNKWAMNIRPGEWLHIEGIKELTIGQIIIMPSIAAGILYFCLV